MDSRTWVSLRWLGSSHDWLLRAVRSSRFCHGVQWHWLGRRRASSWWSRSI